MVPLEFHPHPVLQGIERAKFGRYSILKGMRSFGYQKDFEVYNYDTEERKMFTNLERVNRFLNQ